MGNSIYRFQSFESFVDVVQRRALTLVHPDLWEDPFESYLFKAIKSPQGRENIKQIARKIVSKQMDWEQHTLPLAMLMHLAESNVFFGQSWSRKDQSDALWRIYSFNNYSVRTEIDKESILLLEDVEAHDITYVPNLDLEKELRLIFEFESSGSVQLNLEKILLTKRLAFEHECEVRLLTKPDVIPSAELYSPHNILAIKSILDIERRNGNLSDEQYEKELAKHVEADNISKEKSTRRTTSISFDHIPNFIKSVMLHPLAPDWFDGTLRKFCSDHQLNYLGKSDLYKLNV